MYSTFRKLFGGVNRFPQISCPETKFCHFLLVMDQKSCSNCFRPVRSKTRLNYKRLTDSRKRDDSILFLNLEANCIIFVEIFLLHHSIESELVTHCSLLIIQFFIKFLKAFCAIIQYY